MKEITIGLLLVAAIVALYFVQDKKARAGIGIGIVAVGMALFAGFRRKPEEKQPPTIKPDTHQQERGQVAKQIDEIDSDVDAVRVDTDPDVASLRARLKARRGSLHDAINDRESD